MARVLWVLALAVSASGVREVNFKECKTGTIKDCKVKSVEIEGCLEPTTWVDVDGAVIEYLTPADPKTPCRIGAGSELNVTIIYEPGFASGTLRSQFSIPMLEDCWEANENMCPLPNHPLTACQQTKCPLTPGQERTYETSLKLSNTVPKRSVNSRKVYQMTWKLWDKRNKKKQCCANFPVQY